MTDRNEKGNKKKWIDDMDKAYRQLNREVRADRESEELVTWLKEPIVIFKKADEIEPESINWIWDGWLAGGKIHLLAGASGTGKTTLAVALAASITTGGIWPDKSPAPLGDVLMWSGEDGIEDTLLPRFIACGGDRERLRFISQTSHKEGNTAFNPATDFPDLLLAIRQMNIIPKLIILDPIITSISGDSNSAVEVRRGLQPIIDFAMETQCCVLGIHHYSKFTAGKNPLERVTGSLSFGAVARIVMVTSRLLKSETKALIRAKSNIGPEGDGFEYSFRNEQVGNVIPTIGVLWGDKLEGTAADLTLEGDLDSEEGDRLHEAKLFLQEALKFGSVKVKELKKHARAEDISWRTVERAKKSLKVKSQRLGFGGDVKWFF
jgi:putative DNA primase/helicase